MSRSLFVAFLTSFFLLVGCQYPGEPITIGTPGSGGALGDGGGLFNLWIRTTTTGATADSGDHRVVVTFGDTVEVDTTVALDGEARVFQYREAEHEAGWRQVTLFPRSGSCVVTSDNPLEVAVGYTVVTKSWFLEFSVSC